MTIFFRSCENLFGLVKGESLPDRMSGKVVQTLVISVHRAQITENYKQENNINHTTWTAQSLDLNVCENIWLRIKRALQPIAGNINTQNELIAEIRHVGKSPHELYSGTLSNHSNTDT